MVQKVHSGERITASQYNSVVDALGGADIPSKGFVKTPEGVVQTYGSDLEAQANQRCVTFLQAAVGPALRKESTDISPFGGWDTYESLQETPPPEKHVYVYFGTPSFYNEIPYIAGKNPSLVCNGLPSVFVAWSVGPYHHIVTDQDILTNNPDSDFDNFGTLKDDKVQCVYPGWVETPFQPTSGTSVYGCFYKLFDITGQALAGSIFILTVAGWQDDPQEPGSSVRRYPYHSFTQTFVGPDGHTYVVGEQFSTPVLICEFQDETKIPGTPDNSKGMTSSKLVQCHTGPITHQEPQEAQLAWSVLGFVTGNDSGDLDETEITSFPEMKIGNGPARYLEQWGVISAGDEKYLWAKNLQVSGKQAIVKLDPDTPVIEGVLSLEQVEAMELPFVNVCKEPRGFIESSLDYVTAAYLVLPKTLVDLPSACASTGLAVTPTGVRAIPVWREALLSWEIIFGEWYSAGSENHLGSFMACAIRFDGTGSYTWHVPRSSVFQGSWANSLRDIAITDRHYTREVQGEVSGNCSIQYTGWLSATDSDGVHYNQPDETWKALSACHPKALQLFRFDRQDYLSSLTDALSSDRLSSLDLVVRHRVNNGSVLEYYTLSSLLSAEFNPISCDTEATAGLQNKYKSLDTVLSGDGSPYYELHDFQKADEPGYGTNVKFQDPQHEEDFSIANNTQFVVRKSDGAGGYEIKYQHLSVFQEHERVDSTGAVFQTKGRSLQYETYPGIGTNYNVMELYNFSSGCTTSLVSADISADSGNAVLVRKRNGAAYDLQYMDFKSIDNFAKKYVGDSQLDQQPLTPVDKSANVYWSNNDQKYAVELYNFKNGADTAYVNVRTDGCTYWWPQDVKTTSQMNEWDYVLVKHLDSQGNQELRYKQLAVTMPDLSDLGDGLSALSTVVYEHSVEITSLSTEVVELSGKLSADYWEQGGDSTTCYGSSIGDSTKTAAIDLDNKTLEGCWIADTQLDIGCTWFEAASGDGYVAGTLKVAGCLEPQSDVRCRGVVYADRGLTIGNTAINEAQLSALLQLVNAPQQLHNL